MLPLHKLKVASSNPKYFVLGKQLGQESTSVYKTVTSVNIGSGNSQSSDSRGSSKSSICAVNCNDVDETTAKRVLDITIPGDGLLHPNSSITVPLWIRGNDIGGIHEVDFLFYYEAAATQQQSNKARWVQSV